MEKKNDLIKMTPAEVADFMWEHLNSKENYDFIVPWGEDPEGNNNIYCCAMIIVAGHSAIMVNAYGGGELFTYEVPLTGKFAKEGFVREFSRYLSGLGGDIWVNPKPNKPANRKQPAAMKVCDFVNFLHDLGVKVDNATCRFHQNHQDGHNPDGIEVFSFHYVDVGNDALIAVCNSAAGNKWFAHDITFEEGQGSFDEAFLEYLKQHGITGSVKVYS